MADSDIDEAVASLPEQTLRRIDEAFDCAVSEPLQEEGNLKRPRKRRRIAQDTEPEAEPELAGGFLLPDDDDQEHAVNVEVDAGGGFLVEDDDEKREEIATSQPTHIPLSLIPRALQLLDLDPSDTQVLSVFQNAASSWSSNGNKRKPRTTSNLSDEEIDEEEPEQVVGRSDWRAVCAALMPTPTPMGASDSPLSSLTSEEEDELGAEGMLEEESDSGSSAVQSADLDLDEESSSDEYIPGTKGKGKGKSKARSGQAQRSKTSPSSQTKTQTKKSRKSKTKDASSDSTEAGKAPKQLTPRQQEETLAAFALFFPNKLKGTRCDLSDEELSQKRLTIRDVANAAASIKEKITAEEIIEMLTIFSPSSIQSSPSMSFQEFQQIMITARLV